MLEFVSRVMIGGIRNWSKNICSRNLVFDESNKLQNSKKEENVNSAECYGVFMVDTLSKTRQLQGYYTLDNASRFLYLGNERIASSSCKNGIETIALNNPDDSKLLLTMNSRINSTK